MKLNELYKHRTDFTVIGLTGRTGSGCTKIAELLSNDFENLKNEGLKSMVEINSIDNIIFKRKYEIVYNYFNNTNKWEPFTTIKYRDVLLFVIFNKCGNFKEKYQKLFNKYYLKDSFKNANYKKILDEIEIFINENEDKLKEIYSLRNYLKAKTQKLNLLHTYFFKYLVDDIGVKFSLILEQNGYYERTLFFHQFACDLRTYGDSLFKIKTKKNISNIYFIAGILNRIIKSKRKFIGDKKLKIVIDSLRNSLEIMFFKERFSGFYMLAVKDIIEIRKERLEDRFKNKIEKSKINQLIKKLFELDETEYKINDFTKGEFNSPDVENCIQKSDYHISNIRKQDFTNHNSEKINNVIFSKNDFLTREEQLMKFIAAINHPGIITPSAIERSMQIAYSAKLNSGCTSRKVGAAILDKNFSLKSIGWNDVAKDNTPCNLRNVEDFINENLKNNPHYSEFEKGNQSEIATFKYKNRFPNNFKKAILDYFKNYDKEKMEGLNCSFCFKTVHNHYEGESNQVHTRSLHAEENAMLQITKYGGTAIEFGYLFTTASPCELCSKKAYQLGIKTIFYIDPYPGISIDQLLLAGQNKPKVIAFNGAYGTAYSRLYETYLSPKDEISLLLDLKSNNKLSIQLNNILKDIDEDEIKKFVKVFRDNPDDSKVIEMVKKGISKK